METLVQFTKSDGRSPPPITTNGVSACPVRSEYNTYPIERRMTEPLDLKDFEWNIEVRQLTMDDFDALVSMAEICFPGIPPISRDQLASQLAVFPEGQLGVEIDGRLAASSSSLILEYNADLEWHNWKAIADGGYIRNHVPRGDTLYGIEIMVHPDFRGMKLSRRLYDGANSCVMNAIWRGLSLPGAFPTTINTPIGSRPGNTSNACSRKTSTIRF